MIFLLAMIYNLILLCGTAYLVGWNGWSGWWRSEEHTSELQSH